MFLGDNLNVLLWLHVCPVDVLRNRPPQSYTDMTMEMKDDLMDIPLPLESMDAEPCAIEEPPDIDIDLGDGDGNDSDFGAGGPDAFNDPAGTCSVCGVLLLQNEQALAKNWRLNTTLIHTFFLRLMLH